MNEAGPGRTAVIVLPLLLLCAALPNGLDRALHPAIAASLPLLWAMACAAAMGLGHAARGLALPTALPYSAWAAASLSAGDGFPWVSFLASACTAGSAWYAAGEGRGAALLAPLLFLATAGVQLAAGPLYALALAALLVSVRLAGSVRGRRP